MNLPVIPTLVALVAAGLLVLSMAVGLLLQLNPRWGHLGRSVVYYSAASLSMAIIFSCAGGLPLGLLLGMAFSDSGVLFGFWASGPIGLLVGLEWARRNRGARHVFLGKRVSWRILGGVAFGLLLLGVWFTKEAYDDMAGPPKKKLVPTDAHKPKEDGPAPLGIRMVAGLALPWSAMPLAWSSLL